MRTYDWYIDTIFQHDREQQRAKYRPLVHAHFHLKFLTLFSLHSHCCCHSKYMDCITFISHSSTPTCLRAHHKTSRGTLSKAFSRSTKAIQSSFFFARYFSYICLTMMVPIMVLVRLCKCWTLATCILSVVIGVHRWLHARLAVPKAAASQNGRALTNDQKSFTLINYLIGRRTAVLRSGRFGNSPFGMIPTSISLWDMLDSGISAYYDRNIFG